ncbi:MAG: hypothetical protein ABW352_15335 [Polyangiales bacterium]
MSLPRSLRAVAVLLVLTACGGETSPRDEGDDDVPSEEGTNEEQPELDARVPDARTPDARVADARAPEQVADAAEDTAEDAGAVDAGELAAGDAGRDAGRDAGSDASVKPPVLTPAFHIPLRVHRGDSGLTGRVLANVLEEMNQIWWNQAAICFEIEIVRDDQPRSDGFDFWFHRSKLGCNTNANGVYCGDHDIHSLDAPSLGRASDPAWNVRLLPARTAAHELGHGLNLQHFNDQPDSNDSLMSSGRQGFKLHASEIDTARRRARTKAQSEGPSTPCAAVPVVD